MIPTRPGIGPDDFPSAVRTAFARRVARGCHTASGRQVLAGLALAAFLLPTAAADPRVYVQVALGGHTTEDVTVASRSNDRASICDEFINPRALAVPGCVSPDRGAGDGWRAPFDSGRGFFGEAELGYRLSSRFRVAAVFGRATTDFDQTVSSTDASGADFDKIGNELEVGEETLGTFASNELFLVAVRDWPNRTPWTPYLGAGIGVARAKADFSWLWARSADPVDIATGLDQVNSEEIRRNLAGTVSTGRATLRDTMFGYVIAAGVDRVLSQSLSVGLRLQFKRFGAFESDPYAGDQLRSHVPNLRLDGSEPVVAWSRTADNDRFAFMLTLRYSPD